ncbi:MAG TPA: hypothetical protein VH309_14220, partial [Elusimicrobiota bacterium]|nr:hypothetical protein [Elusimicrobiota bacterium]
TAAADAASLRSEGLEDYKAGRTDAALADFQAALSTAPGDAQTLMSEAAVLADLGRDDDALAAYASALESARAAADGPALLLAADVLSSRATLLARRGRAAEAASDLEDALRTAPPEWPRRADARRRLKALTRRSRRAP